MDMLKQQVQDQIDALNDMKAAYGEIIDQRKAALDAAKKEADYEKDKASKLKEIAKLQARIDALSLDDSREAQAERAKLQEEMAELQEELSDTQSDYAIENQKNALDEMKDAYNDEKDDEIKKLEDSVSSQQKLYEKAMDYIRYYWENGWSGLKSQLLQWNYDVGNNLESEITTAWDNCLNYISSNPLSLAGDIIDRMKQNSSEWHTASSDRRNELSSENKNYASQIGDLTGSEPILGKDGVWYLNGRPLYGGQNSAVATTVDRQVNMLVSRMKQNSDDWHKAGTDERARLKADNADCARQIEELLKNHGKIGKNEQLTLGKDGWWYLPDGRKLYDVYDGKYHTSGTVGAIPTPKQNEIIATLERGEIVLDQQKQDTLYRIIDLLNVASDRIGTIFGGHGLTDILASAQSGLKSPPNNITNNQQETIHFGDVYIYGGSEETVTKHREVTRQFTNEILRQLDIRR